MHSKNVLFSDQKQKILPHTVCIDCVVQFHMIPSLQKFSVVFHHGWYSPNVVVLVVREMNVTIATISSELLLMATIYQFEKCYNEGKFL
jgi:hypothetical protein